METKSSNSLSFLDVKVSRNNNKFTTSVYGKPTFSGLGTSFFSFIPFLFKLNAIKSLVFRSYSICSDYFLLHCEFQFLNNYFVSNGFPSGLVHSVIRHFLDHKFTNGINNNANDRPVQYFSLPYFGSQSEKLKIELLKLFSKYVPNVDFKVILVNNFKLGSFFKYKDRLPCGSRSSVVYEFVSPLCRTKYVGSTSRTLCSRTAEHKGVSVRTGAPLSTPPHSAARAHCEQTHGVQVEHVNFSILDSSENLVSLRILESLYIHKLGPELNESSSAFPLHIIR